MLPLASDDWVLVLLADLLVIQLNRLDDVRKGCCCFFGSGPVFNGKLGNFFLQNDRNMLQFYSLSYFMPLEVVNIGPGGGQLLLLRKRLNDVKLKRVEENLIKDLVHFLVGQTHSLQIDLIVVNDLRFCYLLVAFGQDVVWVFEQLVVEHADGFGLA